MIHRTIVCSRECVEDNRSSRSCKRFLKPDPFYKDECMKIKTALAIVLCAIVPITTFAILPKTQPKPNPAPIPDSKYACVMNLTPIVLSSNPNDQPGPSFIGNFELQDGHSSQLTGNCSNTTLSLNQGRVEIGQSFGCTSSESAKIVFKTGDGTYKSAQAILINTKAIIQTSGFPNWNSDVNVELYCTVVK